MALPPTLRLSQHLGSVLDRSGGFWRLGPPGLSAPVSRRYEPGTNVLETAWMTGSGWVTVRDFLTFGDWRPDDDFEPHRRPPPDDDAEHVLVRMVECLQGEVDIEMICQPAFDYGSTRVDWERRGDSATDAEVTHDGLHLILTGDLGLGVDGGDARARHRMKAGEVRFSALSWGPSPIPRLRARIASSDGSGRSTSGAAGSRAAASRTIPGAPRCSARHSFSRV